MPAPTYAPRWSNCVWWTAHQLHHHGGYGLVRRGFGGVPFHVLWSPDAGGEVWAYEPLAPYRWRLSSWRTDLLLIYRGHVVQGDVRHLGEALK